MDLTPETLQYFASLGVGGLLAAGMFYLYRKDSLSWQAAWKGQADTLMDVVTGNTAVQTELTTLIKERLPK